MLHGRRSLVTHADRFMGPALCEVLREQGGEVVASTAPLRDPREAAEVVAAAGRVDVLVANLAVPAPSTPAGERAHDEAWRARIRATYGSEPRIRWLETPLVVDNALGRIVAEDAAAA